MDSVAADSVSALIAGLSEQRPGETALVAPGRPDATFAVLAGHVSDLEGVLRARGIGAGDRVALVVENGPEAASAFLGIASAAVCAPLNPAYRASELEFYLTDLRARAVVVSDSLDTPARDVAVALGIDVLEARVDSTRAAGLFSLGEVSGSDRGAPPARDPTAEALVLHTSGTTARPKIVPLSHRHLMASARNVASTLELSPADRCLNVMPLFHIHGLVAAILASLGAGGSVICTPGFHQLRFFDWLAEFAPTWTTAVPTMHQALLERGRRDPSLLAGNTLRFVRSSSAALPAPVFEGLEELLGVPVVEAYGMTEAAHQMASNPLPPGERKAGAVGRPAGPEIAILDSDGVQRPTGEIGEVAIRGSNVFAGYESNPEANALAFAGDWFRTGDEGRLDEDGYLVLHGRLKEIINRGGEKVSPLEVDELLLGHPAVAQAVTFGIPDDRLGEEVAAAVVLREGETASARELQDFVAQTAAPFKVPRRIVVLGEIPKGPTGKVQRIGLASRLEIDTAQGLGQRGTGSPFLEESIARIWSDVLALPGLGPLDDFFALGGDSILGAEAVARVRNLVGRPDLPVVSIVRAPTPRAMAAEIEAEFGWTGHGVLRIQAGTNLPPVFVVHGVDGEIVRFAGLARMLGEERPVYGLRAPGLADGEELPGSVETLAEAYLEGIRSVQPTGPHLIVSYCMGATIALELAHVLGAAGTPPALVLIDPRLQRPRGPRFTLWIVWRRARERTLGAAVLRRLRRVPDSPSSPSEAGAVGRALARSREAYACRPTQSVVALLRSDDFGRYEMPGWYLARNFPHTIVDRRLIGKHTELFRPPALERVGEAVRDALSRVEQA